MQKLLLIAGRVLRHLIVLGVLLAGSAHAYVIINSEPQSQTVVIGSNATFSVDAYGSTPFTYIWYKYGNVIASGTDSFYTISNAQAFNAGQYQVGVLGSDHSYAASGYFTLTVNTDAITLINVDFGSGTASPKTGAAAVGQTTNDFWNFYTTDDGFGGHRNDGQVANLKLANGTPTSAVLEVTNAPGSSTNGVADPMFNSYVYSLAPLSVQPTVTLSNLPAGTFDFYIYGHQESDTATSAYELLVDNISIGSKTNEGSGWNTTLWYEGVHYVTFRGVQVSPGQLITINVLPGNTNTSPYGVIAGLQIAQMSGAPVYPTANLNGPTNRYVAIGSTNVISATVNAAAPLTNQWYLNGQPLSDDSRISGSTTASLTISGITTNDAGSYWLTVSNPNGSATTATATWIVGEAPSISLQPQTQTVVAGNAVTFTSDGTGELPLTYQWYLGSTALTNDAHRLGTTTSSLSLTNVVASDGGNYTMVLSNAFGTATSTVASLTVLLPPSISTQPVGRSLPAGLPTVFNVSATGTGPLSYRWKLNGTDIPGATASTYTLASVNAGTIGSYTVTVTNSVGSTTSVDALLTIGPVAGWGFNLQNQCLPPAGLSNVIEIAATQNNSYALRADGSLAKWGLSSAVAANLTNLVAVAMAYNDTGIALRADGTTVGINRSVSPGWTNVVSVAAGPSYVFVIRDDGSVGSSGTSAPVGSMRAVALAASSTQLMALRDDATVAMFNESGTTPITPAVPLTNIVAIACGYNCSFAVKADGNVVAFGTNALIPVPAAATNVVDIAVSTLPASGANGIASALRRDGSIVSWGYSSSPTNIVNPSIISNTVATAVGVFHGLALVSDGSPQIVHPPIGGTAYTGSDVTLRVRAVGAPQLNYQWSRDGVAIAGATNSTLILANIQASDAGTYQVTITNALGAVSSLPVPITVGDHAPFVNISPAGQTAYVGTKATLGVPINGSGPMSIQWRYHPVASLGIYTNIPNATNEFLIFDPVMASSGGSYSVIASNAFGTYGTSLISLSVRQVVAWGDSTYGKTNVPASLTNAIAICGGNYYNSYAMRDDGSVFMWGLSGLGSALTGVSNAVEIATPYGSGNSAFFALRNDGTVINNASTTYSNAVNTMTNIVAIEADIYGSTFLRPDGSIIRLNSSGMTNLVNVSNIVALSQWDDGFRALRADGTVFSSGSGGAAPATTNVAAVASSRYAGTFLRRDQTIVDWGRSLPATVPTNGYLAIAACNTGTELGTRIDGSLYAWGGFGNATNLPQGLPKLRIIDGGYSGFLALCTPADFDPTFLHTALNTTNLVVSSANSPQWYAEHDVTHDGASAARSASIGRNTASSMRMLITNGPIQIGFWWKVSSETNHDFLTFSIGGVPQASISGDVDWQRVTFNVPAGPQMLVWTYSKDGSGTSGQDAGWVDQFFVGPQPPYIYQQPQSQTVFGGSTVQFIVGATGQTPLDYRWYRNNDPTGAGKPGTNVLTYSNVHRSLSGTYKCVVSNLLGTVTSSNAVLVVHTPQQFEMPLLQPDGTFLISSRDTDNLYLSSQTSLTGFHAQYTSNFVDWVPANTSLFMSNGYINFIDYDATNDPVRFYRILEDW